MKQKYNFLLLTSLIGLLLICGCKINQQLLNLKKININDTKIGIESEYFNGTIFTEKYPFNEYFNNKTESIVYWTPSEIDISKIENDLRAQLNKLARNNPMNGYDDCPKIHKNLNHYYRQYVGIENEKGEKIVHINFLWDKNRDTYGYDEEYIQVFDGCSYYWEINFNLTTNQFFGLWINGVA
ncbi:hypothetical protein V6R21_06495 [Limibacter armeniacum]|uniref:hypothetical protein n=1 Tax=Limibacter armeniacum TaxID=466084 RepID=UPI002FE5E9A5